MGFIDKMCYEVAGCIIEDFFWKNYQPTIVEEKSWYDNLNNFLVKEWVLLQNIKVETDKFTENEEHAIISDAMQILLDKMGIDGDEWEDHEDDVSWDRFDDIIGHYTCYYKPKMYRIDGNELINEFRPAAGNMGDLSNNVGFIF
jgi:hypothetical protein